LGAQNLNGLHKPVLRLDSCHGGLKVKKPHIELIARDVQEAHRKITDVVILALPPYSNLTCHFSSVGNGP